MKKKALILTVGFLAPFMGACSSAAASSSSHPSAVYYLFDTTISVTLYDGTEAVLDEIGGYLTAFNALTDGFVAPAAGETTLYTVNNTNETVTVPEELAQVLSFALTMQTETDGYLDPLIGNLSKHWKAAIEATVPDVLSSGVIAQDLADMKDSSLTVVGDQVTRTGKATVDLGALAKGYSLRKVLSILQENNVQYYFVNAGSSSMIMGKKPSGDGKWRIGFNVGEDKATPAVLTAVDTAMGTSSVTEQGAVIDGKTYSHLINPFTGSALATYVLVSAVNDDPGLDDAMSTAFFLMGEERAKTYASKLGLGYCFYDGTTFSSSPDLEVTLNS